MEVEEMCNKSLVKGTLTMTVYNEVTLGEYVYIYMSQSPSTV